jgi:hypothetical protein
VFDYSNDEAHLRAEIARISPGDVVGYEDFLRYSAGVFEEGYVKLGAVPFLDFSSMIKAASRWRAIRHGARSIRWCRASSKAKSCARPSASTPCWSAATR